MDIRILLIAFKLLFTVKLDFHHFEGGNFFEIFRRETWRRCAMVISTSLVGPPVAQGLICKVDQSLVIC